MSRPSEPRLLVLHALRLKGFAQVDDVVSLSALPADRVTAQLEDLSADDLVLYREGRLTGWALTPTGRKAQEEALKDELDGAGARDAVTDAYKRFLDHNNEMLEICTAWQMKDETTINDHADAAYDAGVIERLLAFHTRVEPILSDLEEAFDRYRGYRPRFEAALTQLRGGDHQWFTKPLIDSYHTVWFQLHEDLLNSLGIERSQEGSH